MKTSLNDQDLDQDQTMIDQDARLLAHKLCREFLNGPWNNISPSDIIMESVRYVIYQFPLLPCIISLQDKK